MMPNQPAPRLQPATPRPPATTAWQAVPAPKPATQPAFPVNAALAADAGMRPKFRAQAPDVAPGTALVMPSPEALGVGSTARPGLVMPASDQNAAPMVAAAVDWNDLHHRLRRLGAVGFHLDQVAVGQWRATFLVPVGAQQTRQVEASAPSDAAAVVCALREAEALVARR